MSSCCSEDKEWGLKRRRSGHLITGDLYQMLYCHGVCNSTLCKYYLCLLMIAYCFLTFYRTFLVLSNSTYQIPYYTIVVSLILPLGSTLTLKYLENFSWRAKQMTHNGIKKQDTILMFTNGKVRYLFLKTLIFNEKQTYYKNGWT